MLYLHDGLRNTDCSTAFSQSYAHSESALSCSFLTYIILHLSIFCAMRIAPLRSRNPASIRNPHYRAPSSCPLSRFMNRIFVQARIRFPRSIYRTKKTLPRNTAFTRVDYLHATRTTFKVVRYCFASNPPDV